jgi:PAT family beta-lactamase induction signal transducer AmpG
MLDIFKNFIKPQVITMLFLGFSAGIPILLIFSTLGLWLNEAGVAKSTITYFSWAALGYSFKFVWAPIIDKLPIPFLSDYLGQRRSWLLVAQIMIIIAILMMAFVNPKTDISALTMMAYGAVLLGFSSATQDIVIDAYRIESADVNLQSLLASIYIAGYRLGMLVAGAGGLFLAYYFGSTKEVYSYTAWFNTYVVMAGVMLIGIATTFIIKEPKHYQGNKAVIDYVRFLGLFLAMVITFILFFIVSSDVVKEIKRPIKELFNNQYLASFFIESIRLALALGFAFVVAKVLVTINFVKQQVLEETYIKPIKDFFNRFTVKTALLLLLVIGFYRISDIVLGVVVNLFYQDVGFSKIDIALVSKTFGLFMVIGGSFLGGVLSIKYGVFRILLIGAIVSALTNLLFVLLANITEPTISLLYMVITADNLAAGLAGAAFVAFLSKLTNIEFTAVQYAIFSSLMTLLPKIFGGYSGTIIESFGYSNFFMLTTIIGLPVIWLTWKMRKYIL